VGGLALSSKGKRSRGIGGKYMHRIVLTDMLPVKAENGKAGQRTV